MVKPFASALIAALTLGLALPAAALPVFSSTATVSTANRTASFTNLTGGSLAAYSENSLAVVAPNSNCSGFNAFGADQRSNQFWYACGGNSTYATIKGTDNAVFSAIDFLIGNGQGGTTTNFRWYALLNGTVTGTGLVSGVTKGTVVGLKDLGGFTELRLAAAISETDPGFGRHQSIAFDDVRAQLQAVPEPGSIALIGLGLAAICARRRKNAA